MRALALFLVLALAKVWGAAAHGVPAAPLVLPALLWQDACVALLFAAAERGIGRGRVTLGLYAALCAYAALNLVLVLELGTPLTAPMLRAVDATMADSAGSRLGLAALSPALAVAAAAGVLGAFRQRLGPRAARALVVSGLACIAVGLPASRRLALRGAQRTPLVALAESFAPRVPAGGAAAARDWRGERAAAVEPGVRGLAGACAGRNVVLCILESAGAPYLAPYGAPRDPMPRLTRLAAEGLLFESAYAAYPESIKGLAALLFSTTPGIDTRAEDYAHVPAPSLGDRLSEAGYRTALFHSGRFDFLGMRAVLRRAGFEDQRDAGDLGGARESSFGVAEEATVAGALEWVDAVRDGGPFFLTYMPIAGHHPYDAPPGGGFDASQVEGAYLNALHYADRSLGLLLDGLEERGLLEQSVVCVVGDHGQAFGQHPGNYGHTFFLYEENVRVPLVLYAPGAVGPARVRRVASHVDLAPTLLDLLGLEVPAEYDGRSLLRPGTRAALFFTDYSLALVGLREGPFKLVHELGTGRSELYDLRVDPGEREDLAAARAGWVRERVERLRAWCGAARRRVTGWPRGARGNPVERPCEAPGPAGAPPGDP